MLYICIFPAYCFRQRTYVAQGLVNRVLNETYPINKAFSDESNKLETYTHTTRM